MLLKFTKITFFIITVSCVGCVSTTGALYSENASINEYDVFFKDDTLDMKFTVLESISETKLNNAFRGKDAYKNNIREVKMRVITIIDLKQQHFDTIQIVNPTISPVFSDSVIIKQCYFKDITNDETPDLFLEMLFVSQHRSTCGFSFEDKYLERTKGKMLVCDLAEKKWIFEHLSELSFETIEGTEELADRPWIGFPYWKIDCNDSRRFLVFEYENKYLNAYEYEFPTYNQPFILTNDEIKKGTFLNKKVFVYKPEKGYIDIENFTKM